jgi:hypothetical protein
VESKRQLQDLMSIQPSKDAGIPDSLQSADPGLINPARWSNA